MKIAHFSDLHFSHFTFNPLQFFSKTWIGNANLLLKRGQRLKPLKAESVKKILQDIKPDLCIFSGDFTTTSQVCEYQKAQNFIQELQPLGIPLLKIPGNHDHYTKKAFKKKLFYTYLTNHKGPKVEPFSLKDDGFEIYLYDEATLILLDQTKATPWFTAYGHITEGVCQKISSILAKIPAQIPFIFVGHFPLISDKKKIYHHALKGACYLEAVLKTHQPSFYLHGHNHTLNVIQQPSFIQIDSGSLSDVQKGSFIVLDTQNHKITPYLREGENFTQGNPLL